MQTLSVSGMITKVVLDARYGAAAQNVSLTTNSGEKILINHIAHGGGEFRLFETRKPATLVLVKGYGFPTFWQVMAYREDDPFYKPFIHPLLTPLWQNETKEQRTSFKWWTILSIFLFWLIFPLIGLAISGYKLHRIPRMRAELIKIAKDAGFAIEEEATKTY